MEAQAGKVEEGVGETETEPANSSSARKTRHAG